MIDEEAEKEMRICVGEEDVDEGELGRGGRGQKREWWGFG